MSAVRRTNFILLLIASVIGLLVGCFMLLMGWVGYLSLQEQETLQNEGVIGIGQVVETDVSVTDCYRVRYKITLDGVDHFPERAASSLPDWSDCLEPIERVQAEQFGTVQVIYLPDQPEISQPAGGNYFDIGITQFLSVFCFGGGLLIPFLLIFGWWRWSRKENEEVATVQQNASVDNGETAVYPLFSQYEAFGQKVGLLYAEHQPKDNFEQALSERQATYDEIDQWIVVDHFGDTPPGSNPDSQLISIRFFIESKRQKPTIEAIASLLKDISSHPRYKSAPLTIKFGIQSLEVTADLKIPLVPLLPKRLPKDEYLILSNRTSEIAGFQVQSIVFPSDLDQRVDVIRHPRYPSSGRYPSSKVLDLIQADANTNMHLQMVVPRKEGRGQKFEIHSSYQTVPTKDFSAAALFAIARSIHTAGLASDTIQLADYPNEPLLSVNNDLTVNISLSPQPNLTRIEYAKNIS